jgi:hypothetical protein
MQRSTVGARPSKKQRRALAALGAALLGIVAIAQPNGAEAHGSGGFHGGGGFAGGGGFHANAGHIGDFGAGRGGIAAWHDHDGDRREGGWGHAGDGWHDWRGWNGRNHWHRGWWWGGVGGWPYYGYQPYAYGYDYGQPTGQPRYYCADPPGYYPDVTQCASGWQAMPAG